MSRVDVATEVNCLRGLIDLYWDIAYKEGKDGRRHDTEDGKAQKCRHLIETSIKALVQAASHD